MKVETLAWLFKPIGAVGVLYGLSLVLNERAVVGALVLVVFLALYLAGALLSPGAQTGAHTARYMMETNNDLHMVKPPSGNVLDPSENTRFSGR